MIGEAIERLTRSGDLGSDGTKTVDVGVDEVVIAESLAGREAELLAKLALGHRVAVLSDQNTRRALGARVEAAIASSHMVTSLVLSDAEPTMEVVEQIERGLAENTHFIIAIGSGSINDLAKYVAARQQLPYVVFATAPSMNGYTSMGASITTAGRKSSMPAQPPRAAYFDLEVLCSAPSRLIGAGVGEAVCRPTAQVDWLLSHLLRDTSYSPLPFELLREDEALVLSRAAELCRGDVETMGALTRLLVLSGFGMTIAGGSYPASQGEHLISHYAEAMLETHPSPLHGEKVGVASVYMAELQQRILELDEAPVVSETTVTLDDMIAHFGDRGRHYWSAFLVKRLSHQAASALNERLTRDWPKIRAQLSAVTRPAAELKQALDDVGSPSTHSALGWSDEQFDSACTHARWIRDRFTFLDLAAEAGISLAPIA